MLERFAKLPRSQRLLIALGSYVLVALLVYVGLVSSTLSGIESETKRKTDLTAKRDEVKARADNRAAFEAELDTLGAQLKQALTELPNDREIPGLLSEIDSLARTSGLEVRRFQPLPEVSHEYFADVPVQIVMDGSYHEVAIFFDRVSKMNRIVAIEDIQLSDPKEIGMETSLTISGKVVTFRFLSEEEVKAAADAKKQTAKKGGGKEE
jgi:type IV pilus assembly protein PilO